MGGLAHPVFQVAVAMVVARELRGDGAPLWQAWRLLPEPRKSARVQAAGVRRVAGALPVVEVRQLAEALRVVRERWVVEGTWVVRVLLAVEVRLVSLPQVVRVPRVLELVSQARLPRFPRATVPPSMRTLHDFIVSGISANSRKLLRWSATGCDWLCTRHWRIAPSVLR